MVFLSAHFASREHQPSDETINVWRERSHALPAEFMDADEFKRLGKLAQMQVERHLRQTSFWLL